MPETPEAPASTGETPTEGVTPAEQPASAEKPAPWGDDFKPELAWERIQKQARDIDKLRQSVLTEDQKVKLEEYDRLAEASKSELELARGRHRRHRSALPLSATVSLRPNCAPPSRVSCPT